MYGRTDRQFRWGLFCFKKSYSSFIRLVSYLPPHIKGYRKIYHEICLNSQRYKQTTAGLGHFFSTQTVFSLTLLVTKEKTIKKGNNFRTLWSWKTIFIQRNLVVFFTYLPKKRGYPSAGWSVCHNLLKKRGTLHFHAPIVKFVLALSLHRIGDTGCSLNIVLFRRFKDIFRTLASLGFP